VDTANLSGAGTVPNKRQLATLVMTERWGAR
jgi:hypothetical protein